MKYQQIKEEGTEISYRVTDHGIRVAEFSYHMKDTEDTAKDGEGRFWLDGIRLFGQFAGYKWMYTVLQFVCYKCWSTGAAAIYLKISWKNLYYMELYKKFGFYIIAEEMREIQKGITICEYVMKYPLPQTRDEEYSHYIRGK